MSSDEIVRSMFEEDRDDWSEARPITNQLLMLALMSILTWASCEHLRFRLQLAVCRWHSMSPP